MKGTILLGDTVSEEISETQFSPVLVIAILIKELVSVVGVIVHEFSHYLACVLTDVDIHSIKFPMFSTLFSDTDNTQKLGSITYSKIDNYWQIVFINTAPLVINTVLASTLTYLTVSTVYPPTTLHGVYYFIILSIFAKAVPSQQDISNIEDYSHTNAVGITHIFIVKPLKGLNRLSAFFVDYIIAGVIFFSIILL
jgi:hypothetical protein